MQTSLFASLNEVTAQIKEQGPLKPILVEDYEKPVFIKDVILPRWNKNCSVEEYFDNLKRSREEGGGYDLVECAVTRTVLLKDKDFDRYTSGDLMDSVSFLQNFESGNGSHYEDFNKEEFTLENGGFDWSKFFASEHKTPFFAQSFEICAAIVAEDGRTILVNPSGHNYARYCAFAYVDDPFNFEQLMEEQGIGDEDGHQVTDAK